MLFPASLVAQTESETSAARAAATVWLSKLDANQFSECWELLSSDLKKGVSRWRWNLQGKLGRMMMGEARSRKEKSVERTAKSPGGRSGEFVLFRYETVSQKRGAVIEEVAVQKDHDGQWRVGGYSIGQEQK
jgi:hypothetical protein